MGSSGKNSTNKKQISKVEQSQKVNADKRPKQQIKESGLHRLDLWMAQRLNLIFYISLFLTILFGAFYSK